MVYGIRIRIQYGIRIQKDSVYVYDISKCFSIYGIRIQKDSVYGIWYKDSEGFSIW